MPNYKYRFDFHSREGLIANIEDQLNAPNAIKTLALIWMSN